MARELSRGADSLSYNVTRVAFFPPMAACLPCSSSYWPRTSTMSIDEIFSRIIRFCNRLRKKWVARSFNKFLVGVSFL